MGFLREIASIQNDKLRIRKIGRADTNTSFSFETNNESETLSERAQETDLEMDERRKTRTQVFENEKIKTKAQVKKLNVLEEWKYTREWLDKKFGDGFDKKDEQEEQENNYQELLSDYEREQTQTDMTHPKIRREKMRYEPFDLPTYYVIGQYGYTVKPQQGTGLVDKHFV